MAVPIYLSVLFFSFVLVVYPALGMLATPRLDDVRNVTDNHAIYRRGATPASGIPPVSDCRPADVAKMLEKEQKVNRTKSL